MKRLATSLAVLGDPSTQPDELHAAISTLAAMISPASGWKARATVLEEPHVVELLLSLIESDDAISVSRVQHRDMLNVATISYEQDAEFNSDAVFNDVTISALTVLEKCCTVHQANSCKELHQALPLFIHLISSTNDAIASSATAAAGKVLSMSNALRRSAVESGAIDALIVRLTAQLGGPVAVELSVDIARRGGDPEMIGGQVRFVSDDALNSVSALAEATCQHGGTLTVQQMTLSSAVETVMEPLEVILPALPLFAMILQSSPCVSDIRAATKVLTTISSCNSAALAAVFETGLTPTLVRIAAGADSRTRRITPAMALPLLGRFAGGTNELKRSVAESGFIDAFSSALNAEADVDGARHSGELPAFCSVLTKLLNAEADVEEVGIPPFCSSLTKLLRDSDDDAGIALLTLLLGELDALSVVPQLLKLLLAFTNEHAALPNDNTLDTTVLRERAKIVVVVRSALRALETIMRRSVAANVPAKLSTSIIDDFHRHDGHELARTLASVCSPTPETIAVMERDLDTSVDSFYAHHLRKEELKEFADIAATAGRMLHSRRAVYLRSIGLVQLAGDADSWNSIWQVANSHNAMRRVVCFTQLYERCSAPALELPPPALDEPEYAEYVRAAKAARQFGKGLAKARARKQNYGAAARAARASRKRIAALAAARTPTRRSRAASPKSSPCAQS